MKPVISKSAVMTRAWNIYKNNRNMFPRFSDALSRAWEVEKANAKKAIKDAETAKQIAWYNKNEEFISDFINKNITHVSNYYANNRYNGD